jgi:hypothetical protein
MNLLQIRADLRSSRVRFCPKSQRARSRHGRRRFQSDNELNVTGYLTRETHTALGLDVK